MSASTSGERLFCYFDASKTQRGPVPASTIHQLLRDGGLTPESFVWTAGMPDWQPVSRVQELQQQPSRGFEQQHLVSAVMLKTCGAGWRQANGVRSRGGDIALSIAHRSSIHAARRDEGKL